jgi:hypothetical protein
MAMKDFTERVRDRTWMFLSPEIAAHVSGMTGETLTWRIWSSLSRASFSSRRRSSMRSPGGCRFRSQ